MAKTGKRHADLCRDIERYINTISTNAKLRSLDFFVESSYIDKKGESRKCYLLTKKGCDMVANKMTGEKGILFTATYINQFYEVEQQLKKQNGLMMPDFNNPAEAARAWADQYDKNHKLLLENTEMKPKAEFYDDVTGSDDTIDIKQVAKVLNIPKMGRNKLFAFLRDKHIRQLPVAKSHGLAGHPEGLSAICLGKGNLPFSVIPTHGSGFLNLLSHYVASCQTTGLF